MRVADRLVTALHPTVKRRSWAQRRRPGAEALNAGIFRASNSARAARSVREGRCVRSFINWLDHSEEDQRRVREMLQLFSDKDTVDDLGIGTVRDAISNALFPGTSVIQTRARYFLFVPWLFRRAEQQHPQQLVAKATDMERNLIEALRAGGDLAGLIGVDAGKNVRTLPSAIFWGGLIRYGIFLSPSLSIRQYSRHVARGIAALDTEEEIADRIPSFWQREIPEPPPDLFKFKIATFDLTRDESEWLCERIISSDRPNQRASLLTAYIRDLRRGEPLLPADAMWDAALPADTTPTITELVHHAERFSCAAQGAALLYNLMLAEERRGTELELTDGTSVDNYRARLHEWTAHATRVGLSEWAARVDDFWSCVLDNAVRIPLSTRLFLDGWANVLASNAVGIESSPEARTLVRHREMQHKRGQARLANKKRLAEWAGEAGTSPLVFRWPQVQRMLTDIADGLSGLEEDEHAVA